MVNPSPQLILLLVTDQFRLDAFNPSVTPNLYHKLALATNATTFTNAYVSTPVCTPARAGLLTGKSPWAHGMLGYGFTVNCPKYPTTVPSVLKDLGGYETFAVGKNHFGWNRSGSYVDHGFEQLEVYDAMTHQPHEDEYLEFFHQLHPGVEPLSITCGARSYNEWKACPYGSKNESEHPTPWTTRHALDYLNRFDFTNSSKKMFLKVSYHRPHSPYDPPKRLLDKHLAGEVPTRFINNTSWDQAFLNTSKMDRAAWNGDPGESAARHSRAGYLASCEFVDEGMGEVFDWLKAHNVWDSSLIVWTTDHGDMNGDHNLWRKGYPWESSSHVNLVVKLPSESQGDQPGGIDSKQEAATAKVRATIHHNPRQSDAIVETRDIAVTFYDYLGLLHKVKRRDPLVDGESLVHILSGSTDMVRTWLDLELSRQFRDDIHWNAIVGIYTGNDRDGKDLAEHGYNLWKYIFNVLKGDEQLFCLSKDRHETYDLAKLEEYQEILEHWRATMVSQFETEKRDERWVQDGKLVAGRQPIVFASNFPCGEDFPVMAQKK